MRLDRWWTGSQDAGRFATVALDCTRQGPEAQRRIELRWKAAREALRRDAVPCQVLDELGERLTTREGPGGSVGRLLAADLSRPHGSAVVLDQWFPEPSTDDTTSCGPVPDLRSLARALQRHPTYITAVLDRSGADVTVHPTPAAPPARERVDGDHDVVHKVRAGDASQQRLQRRAEDSWQQNAATVAGRLATLCREHRPAAVVVLGDEHARSWLRREASPEVRALLVSPNRTASEPGSGSVERAVRSCLDSVIAAEVERALSDFLQNEGRQDRAAQGRQAVSAALRRGQVARLLLVDRPGSSVTVGVAPDGLPLTESDAEAQSMPIATAMLAGGAATAADITLVPEESGLVDGVAAVLRWSDATTPRDSARSMPGHGEGGGW